MIAFSENSITITMNTGGACPGEYWSNTVTDLITLLKNENQELRLPNEERFFALSLLQDMMPDTDLAARLIDEPKNGGR